MCWSILYACVYTNIDIDHPYITAVAIGMYPYPSDTVSVQLNLDEEYNDRMRALQVASAACRLKAES